jgi:lipopolysaccharide export system permease protein
MTFFMVMFVLILQFLWRYIDDLVGKGLDFLVILELMVYAAANLVQMALPLAILLASIMTMGNLGEHNELLALKASGISLQRIIAPLFVVALLFSVGGFLFADKVLPYTNLKFSSLLFSVQKQRPELQIKPGVFYNGIQGYTIKVDKRDEKTGLLHNIIIYDHSKENGNNSITLADSGYLKMTKNEKYLILTLYDGHSYEDVKEKAGSGGRQLPFRSNSFSEQEVIFEMEGYGFNRSDENLFKNQAKMLNIKQLSITGDSLRLEQCRRIEDQLRRFFHSPNFVHGYELFQESPARRYAQHTDSLMRTYSAEQQYDVAAEALKQAREAKSAFANQIEELKYTNRLVNMNDVQWHLKFTYPFACLIFFLIGAPLGAIIRRGGFGTPFLVSLLVFLLYYVVSISFEKMAKDGAWDMVGAMWMSSFVTLPLGAFFMYMAAKEKSISYGKKPLAWIQSRIKKLRNSTK